MISNRSVSVLVAVAMVFVTISSHCQQRRGTSIANDQSIADKQAHHNIHDCMDQLEMYPVDKGLTRKDFASLVDALSHSKTRGGYSHLPLAYSLVFNVNACLNSRDCIGEHATISIINQTEREFTCMSITSLLVEESTCSSDNETSLAHSFETDAEL